MKYPSLNLPPYAKNWLLLDLLGIIAGVAGGLGAVLFRYMIKGVQIVFFTYLLPLITMQVGNFNFGYIFLPFLGALIIGPLIMRFAPETKGHGVPEVMEAVALREGVIRKRVAFFKVAVSSITLGSGGSAGREGPIAQIGATVGSFLGQTFKLNAKEKKLMVVCGLSAGIAGTFNAPLGGALFGMEILLRGVGIFNAMPVILASVVGVAVSTSFLGNQPAFNILASAPWEPLELPIYLLLNFWSSLVCMGKNFLWI